ncbi:hypothetical protein DB32_005804 [Sandaracinus amylolyticus]|uniref:Uncharacterized protein n=1 Tax=Sandaracinus amylolyticus TaxID=927083 RepID=A0A0F6W6H8_9BACT|nr:hypothetical protein DB32_005804 [Sandaracinus amylolyticus]
MIRRHRRTSSPLEQEVRRRDQVVGARRRLLHVSTPLAKPSAPRTPCLFGPSRRAPKRGIAPSRLAVSAAPRPTPARAEARRALQRRDRGWHGG